MGYNKRTADRRANYQLKQVFDNIEKGIGVAVKHQDYAAEASRIGQRIMWDLNKKSPRYNDYSGNLTRSYFVYFRLNGHEFMYMTPDSAVKPPQVEISEREQSDWKTYGAEKQALYQFKSSKGSKSKGIKKMYLIQKKRHTRTQGGRYVRNRRENRGMPREIAAMKAHNYFENIPKPYYNLFRSKSGSYNGIAVGNYAPYRRFVEGRGYRVIYPGFKSGWIEFARRGMCKHLEISLKQLIYKFNKGQWMPTTPEGYALYDRKIQRSGYATPEVNAKLAYKNLLY